MKTKITKSITRLGFALVAIGGFGVLFGGIGWTIHAIVTNTSVLEYGLPSLGISFMVSLSGLLLLFVNVIIATFLDNLN